MVGDIDMAGAAAPAEAKEQPLGNNGIEQIKTLGYNFDKNIEQNIEILIERSRMILNEAKLQGAVAPISTNPLLTMWGPQMGEQRAYNLDPAVELLLRASSLLENLLWKSPNFNEQPDWQKENKQISQDIMKYRDDTNKLYEMSEQLKQLTLSTAKKLGMVDQNIQLKRWERFLSRDSKSPHSWSPNLKKSSTQSPEPGTESPTSSPPT